MALVPEDGTGLPAADSFSSLADAITYLDSLGFTQLGEADQPDAEAALRRATGWMSTYYRWKGSRLKGRDQALAFPRTGATDHEGDAVASNEVPVEIKQGVSLAALAELAEPGILTPQINPMEQVKSEKIGPLAFTYRDIGDRLNVDLSGIDGSRPILSDVYDRIKGLIEIRSPVGITVA